MANPIEELRAIAMRAEDKWSAMGIPRVSMARAEACSDQVYEPMLHLVLQGTKSLSIGDQVLQFEPATYFVISVEVPALGQISSTKICSSYLVLSLTLEPTVIAGMLAELDNALTSGRSVSWLHRVGCDAGPD